MEENYYFKDKFRTDVFTEIENYIGYYCCPVKLFLKNKLEGVSKLPYYKK